MAKEKISRELQIKYFGKTFDQMDKMEVLNALSVISARLAKNTGEEKYNRIDRAARSFMDSESKGITGDAAIRRALEATEADNAHTHN